jgi:hypothetical protein
MPLPILLGVIVPITGFLLLSTSWPAFYRFITSLDAQVITAIHAWRFGGLGFLALYVYGILPGMFAWPAALGDLAIGASAVWVARALTREPGMLARPSFVLWNMLGIADLVVAVAMGALASILALGPSGEIAAQPMAQAPLVIVPGFLVPLFIMLHIAALFQARQWTLSNSRLACF